MLPYNSPTLGGKGASPTRRAMGMPVARTTMRFARALGMPLYRDVDRRVAYQPPGEE
jgi:hypothetical protein